MPKSSKRVTVDDKYYRLAKQQGYRARSAFKLVQLHKKYDLLHSKCRKIIDLCAAPGGWLQVAAQYVVKSPETQILGLDLLPIKPIKGVKTYVVDITSEKARQIVKKEVGKSRVDLVLNDGAPNVGFEYAKDAYVQSELVMHSLRFACEHLRKGGSFVTKVFRSSDYDALMWAMKKFFNKVEATKPSSSRDVSAEIFVVCRGYLKPDKIDPKLLDPKFVFADVVDPTKSDTLLSRPYLDVTKSNVNFNAKNREGYHESGVYYEEDACRFVLTSDPVRILGSANKLFFRSSSSEHPLINVSTLKPLANDEVLALCADLKLLNRNDFKFLLKWRTKVRKQLLLNNDSNVVEAPTNESDDDAESVDSETRLENEMADLAAEKNRKIHRVDRKVRRERIKLQRKRDLGAINEFAIDVAEEERPFSLEKDYVPENAKLALGIQQVASEKELTDSKRDRKRAKRFDRDEREGDDYLDDLEENLEESYERFNRLRKSSETLTMQDRRRKRAAEGKAKASRASLMLETAKDFSSALRDEEAKEYDKGLYERMLADDDDDDENGDDDRRRESRKTKRFFEDDVFDGVESSDDENDDVMEKDDDESSAHVEMPLPGELTDKHKRKERRKKRTEKEERKKAKKAADHARLRESFRAVASSPVDNDDEERKVADPRVLETLQRGFGVVEDDDDDDENEIDMVAVEEESDYRSDEYDSEEHATHLAMGALMLKKHTRRDLVESGYNRFAFNDDKNSLPAWFVEDEAEHLRPILPVTKQMVAAAKSRIKDLADRPIKKVAEAKARKKKRKLLAKAKNKAEMNKIMEQDDLTNKLKMRELERLHSKAGKLTKRPQSVFVVNTKSGGRSRAKNKSDSQNQKGGKVKLVDKRMKSDRRGEKFAAAKKRKGAGGGRIFLGSKKLSGNNGRKKRRVGRKRN